MLSFTLHNAIHILLSVFFQPNLLTLTLTLQNAIQLPLTVSFIPTLFTLSLTLQNAIHIPLSVSFKPNMLTLTLHKAIHTQLVNILQSFKAPADPVLPSYLSIDSVINQLRYLPHRSSEPSTVFSSNHHRGTVWSTHHIISHPFVSFLHYCTGSPLTSRTQLTRAIGRGDRSCRAQTSHGKGPQFNSRSSQTSDLQNW